ncbi:uncharacterized protein EV422DRAFT_506887 [Fimicolochytrium jonesii]|uniref:uncharacterized protein n=1 Tax=Fimicolochytrium jonesii TaxID=1396493 RepID=UPI0022FDCFA8|nr:uncharacterized protein EV422DRAFT_506887 [Fimicolochytrium jonesii]KAI8820160.1 hypothetical protein EV422DRAFT_506887 [Fimicolochytrium jonesii]
MSPLEGTPPAATPDSELPPPPFSTLPPSVTLTTSPSLEPIESTPLAPRSSNPRVRQLAALSTSNLRHASPAADSHLLSPATPLTSTSTVFSPASAVSGISFGEGAPASKPVPFPASVRRLRTFAVTLMAAMFLTASAVNVHRYLEQTPLIKSTVRRTTLDLPHIIFCLNPAHYKSQCATSSAFGDAEAVCIGEIVPQDQNEVRTVDLTHHVYPISLPSQAAWQSWKLPEDANVPCHRFAPDPALQFTAYSNTSDPNFSTSIASVNCGYHYRNDSGRICEGGKEWPFRSDRMHTAIFPSNADEFHLSALPAAVIYNNTLDVYLTYGFDQKLREDEQVKIGWTLGQSLSFYYSPALRNYDQAARKATGRTSSIYLRVSLINELTQLGIPNFYDAVVNREEQSYTPIDIFVAMGGVLSFLTTLFIFLFGSRRLQPFGFIHAAFGRQMKVYLHSKYGEFTTLADVAVPRARRRRGKQGRTVVAAAGDTRDVKGVTTHTVTTSAKPAAPPPTPTPSLLSPPPPLSAASSAFPYTPTTTASGAAAAEQRHLRALENFLMEFYVDTEISVPVLGKFARGGAREAEEEGEGEGGANGI